MGISLWPTSSPPAVAQEPSLICLPPRSAAIIRLKEVSLSARASSLTLLVAKTRSGAEEPTVTLAHCRTIASHGPSHECNCITSWMICFVHADIQLCRNSHGKILQKWTPMWDCAHIHESKLMQYIFSHASIYATVSIVCTILSATVFLRLALPVLVFSFSLSFFS